MDLKPIPSPASAEENAALDAATWSQSPQLVASGSPGQLRLVDYFSLANQSVREPTANGAPDETAHRPDERALTTFAAGTRARR